MVGRVGGWLVGTVGGWVGGWAGWVMVGVGMLVFVVCFSFSRKGLCFGLTLNPKRAVTSLER